MTKLLDRALNIALDLAFPPRCALCDGEGTPLCADCIDGLPLAAGRRCERCWMPSRDDVCRHCLSAPPAFASLRAAFVMEGGARRLAHELKYEGLTSLAAPMARLIVGRVGIETVDAVVPVPLHPRRERSRGYNQSRELAKHIAEAGRAPLEPRVLRRTRDTRPLAKTMSRAERQHIMRGAFTAPGAASGKRVLLIDDVVTTGATLDACAVALLEAGAIEVRCLAWARAD